jgi:hypothetical protein
MRKLNKNMVVELTQYASQHTVKETAEHFNVSYDCMQAFLARYKIRHLARKVQGEDNNNYKVGFSLNKKLYWVYYSMIARCHNPNCKGYRRYGARGIKVCEEWRKDNKTFYKWALANGYKEGLTLDRINNDGAYEPANCAWVTNKRNCNHTSRVHFVTYKGKTQSVSDWAEELSINYSTLRNRLNRSKMPVEKAFRK